MILRERLFFGAMTVGLVALVGLYAYSCRRETFNPKAPASVETSAEKSEKAPEFPRGTWLNSKPLRRDSFNGKITLIYFWDYTSVNCLREMSVLKGWEKAYGRLGLQMIWVHGPEYPFAAKKENVAAALKRLRISFPVFLDNDFKLWDAYKNYSWPTRYVINDAGKIIKSQVGEGRYFEMELKIRDEILRRTPETILPRLTTFRDMDKLGPEECGAMTAETYMGSKRSGWWGGRISNSQFIDSGGTVLFKDRGERVERGFFAEGLWTNREDFFEHGRQTKNLTDYLGVNYIAQEVYAVLSQPGGARPTRIYVTRDGEAVPMEFWGADLRADMVGHTYFVPDVPRLYYLVASEDQDIHELKLWTKDKSVAIHSFSFANNCLSDFEHL